MIHPTQLNWRTYPRTTSPLLTFLAGNAKIFSNDYAIGIGFVDAALAIGMGNGFGNGVIAIL